MTPIEQMTVPLWGLVIFMGWTIALVAFLIIVRIRHLSTGGSPKDFGIPNDESLLWRLFRVQSNLIENLPLYMAVVFLITVRGVSGIAINLLIVAYIISRLIHSIIHIAGINPTFRVLSLAVQFACLITLTVMAIL
ncbi:MAPEG family protein [Chlorogloea sp. CCALA 695]|uniref:MAPEG family protein n=1 Tax=Chlorogloea sp. CCALA 695 TaxID=2107693 RepID=UPI000D0584C6|nr:MAPEG family protein [Chlorogloea sp. CCALA 695]PSB34728.1 hypothetical protein C7B70_02490 [Chlorogloea sp. CCALA 695]